MGATNTGGPAFPKTGAFNQDTDARFDSANQDGMTLRDYFAAKAMPAVYADYCAAARTFGFDEDWKMGVALDAYEMADAMIAAREKGGAA